MGFSRGGSRPALPRREEETWRLQGPALDKCTITIQFKSCPVRLGFAFRYPRKNNLLSFFWMKQNCCESSVLAMEVCTVLSTEKTYNKQLSTRDSFLSCSGDVNSIRSHV